MGPHSFVTKVIIKKGNSFVSKVYLFYIYICCFLCYLARFWVGWGAWVGFGQEEHNTILCWLFFRGTLIVMGIFMFHRVFCYCKVAFI